MVNTILLLGIHRSGNHGVINWLIGNLSGKITHINALHHDNLLPEFFFSNSNEKVDSDETIIKDGINYSEREWINFHDSDWLIISMESVRISRMKKQIETFVNQTQCKSILLLRDPLNNAASMFKIRMSRGHDFNSTKSSVGSVLTCWNEHASEMVNEKKLWSSKILFNLWNKDRKFRDEIMADLNLENTDINFGKISGHGKSSFDQKVKDARLLNLDGRYLEMMGNDDFLTIMEEFEINPNLWTEICKYFSYDPLDDYSESILKLTKK